MQVMAEAVPLGFSHQLVYIESSPLQWTNKFQRPGIMIKTTTTKATHRGVAIAVMSDNTGNGTVYSCTNESGKPKVIVKWFATQGEAIANERNEIDAVLR
jgi:hypothetical protein